jgi:ABC-2 type transport system ATP-binding protein
MVGLNDAARTRISALSKGMAQRLALAAALMNDPPVLLLDEPMSGLDPGQQSALRSIIEAVQRQGKTILLSTHRLVEVSALCTHVAILKKGRLVFSGALSDVLTPSRQVTIKVDRIPADLAGRLCAGYPGLSIAGNTITLAGELLDRKSEILRLLLEKGCDIQQLSSARTGLEEIYLEATRA